MKKIVEYLKTKPVAEREAFCKRCGTTYAYVKKLQTTGGVLRELVCINVERESNGAITVEELRPDVDWAYLRGTAKPASSTRGSLEKSA